MNRAFGRLFPGLINVVLIGASLYAVAFAGGHLRRQLNEWRQNRRDRRIVERLWPLLGDNRASTIGGGNIRLVEFIDYECPFCRASYSAVAEALKANRDVKVLIVHYPLWVHEHAKAAARAAVCAESQGRFEEMHRLLSTTDEWFGTSDWRIEAEVAGISDADAFVMCLTSPETDLRLRADSTAAADLGIKGTPEFVYQYGVHRGSISAEAIERYLAR